VQYHEVKVNILFENEANMALVGADTTYTPSCVLYSTFVFLDTEERKRFSQQSHGTLTYSIVSYITHICSPLFLLCRVFGDLVAAHRSRVSQPSCHCPYHQRQVVLQPPSQDIGMGCQEWKHPRTLYNSESRRDKRQVCSY
jgi:hypothetical protein